VGGKILREDAKNLLAKRAIELLSQTGGDFLMNLGIHFLIESAPLKSIPSCDPALKRAES
jgi:hypothetical protein